MIICGICTVHVHEDDTANETSFINNILLNVDEAFYINSVFGYGSIFDALFLQICIYKLYWCTCGHCFCE